MAYRRFFFSILDQKDQVKKLIKDETWYYNQPKLHLKPPWH
jgi:hypothetical protein